jgi:hypothetical protein
MYLSNKQPFLIWRLAAVAALVFGCSDLGFAQNPPPAPTPPPTRPTPGVRTTPRVQPPVWSTKRQVRNESETPAEKSIATDAKVTITLCVSEGKIKVNGWERSEIRAFVGEGSEVGFKVLQKNRQSEKPGWVQVLGFDPSKPVAGRVDECVFGEDIELDVPRGATVNIKSRSSETVITSVAKATVENVGGDIFLSEITQGIDAKTHEGDVTVEKSGGAITLSSIVGNILAFDVSPSEIGDIFKAKTSNGAIVLQKVEHRQMDVSSNSGSIKYDGEFLGGGQYGFRTQNGSIMLTIPETSSCKVNASYGFGSFNSEIPMQNVVNPPNVKIRNLSGVIGKGDATVNLNTYTGRIEIKQQ